MSDYPCYFTEAEDPCDEPIVYVRWIGTRHYSFLCERHANQHRKHIAKEYTVAFGEERIAKLVAAAGPV